jgi:hypothetical protein
MTKLPAKGEEYVCELCDQTFTCAWTPEEAEAEYKENFKQEVDAEPVSVLCEDCYQRLVAHMKGGPE